MDLINVAIENLGAKIKTYSSFIDNLHQPTNILHTTEDSLWATTEGLPQFVIVSLEDLNVNFKSINEIGFMLWHDYETNPKSIELWVAETTDQEFAFWAEFSLDQKKGIQLFEIQPLPKNFIYLKISITETYGAFETYLNQIFLMAEEVLPRKKIGTQKNIGMKKKKELDLEDLSSNLNQLIEMDKRISKSKSKSNKKKKQKILNKNIRESDLSEEREVRNVKQKERIEHSKGSLSSQRPGRSIYFRESEHLPDDEEREFISNDYQSSSSNALSKNLEMRKLKQNEVNSNEESEFLNSLQSKSIGLSPSLNYNSNSNNNSHSISGNQMLRNQQHKSEKYIKENEKFKRKIHEQKEKGFIKNEEEEEVLEEDTSKEDEIEENESSEHDEEREFSNDFIKNTPKYKEVSNSNEEEEENYEEEESNEEYTSSQEQKNYNVALLALSKHVVNLEDNMEAIQRKVEILDMKVLHSHEKIQKEIIEKVENKVEEIVDRKLKRIWSVKNVFKVLEDNRPEKEKSNEKDTHENKISNKKTFENENEKFNYKKNLTKEFFKSDYHEEGKEFAQQQRDKTKTKRRMKENLDEKQKVSDYAEMEDLKKLNRLKTSKSFANIANKNKIIGKEYEITRKENQENRKGPNQEYIADLLERLNHKLKEREVKLNKMQQREKEKQRQSRNIQEQDAQYIRNKKDHYKRVVTNNCHDYY